MWTEQQGKKATHDFLSLYTKDSSFQLQDPRPPPPPTPNKGGLYQLKTYDFLQPLERRGGDDGGDKNRPPVGPAADVTASVAHVLPGGIGTYSISHVSDAGSRAVVKTEIGTCADAGRANGAFSHSGTYAGVAFTLWDQPPVVTKDAATTPTTTAGPRAQWPSPPIAVAARSSGSSFVSLSSSRNHSRQQQLRKRSMDRASGFDDDDDDEDFGGGSRRDGYPHKGEMSAKVVGKGGSILDQRPSTPRSKHSATEQRRRSKINDRFQILRELIPHSDQKRDKASFLLEVIEYIRFLQEKVQKYDESAWTEENAKLMQWSSCQSPANGIADPSLVIKNGPLTAGFAFPGSENSIPVPPPMLSAAHNPTESEVSASVSHKAENPTSFACKSGAATYPQPNLHTSLRRGTGIAQSQQPVSDSDNLTSRSQTHWLRPPCPTGSTVTGDMLNEQEELAIDEGTISVSTTYSQGLLTKLSEALQNSGIDLSQANVSVQITLGKRATNRKTTATTITSRAKDHDNPCSKQVIGQSRVLSCGKEFEQASKRHKSDNS